MAAAAHDPAFAKKVGIPQGVAEEFNEADKRRDSPREEASESRLLKQRAQSHLIRHLGVRG